MSVKWTVILIGALDPKSNAVVRLADAGPHLWVPRVENLS